MSDKVKLVFKKDIGLVAWQCTISVPKDDGKREEQILTARFRVLPQPRLEELYSTRAGNPAVPMLDEALDGFDGLKRDDGTPVADAEAKQSLLAIPYVVDGLERGYFEMLGRRTAKN